MAQRCLWTNRRDGCVIPVPVDAPALFGGRARSTTVFALPEHKDDLRTYLCLGARYGRPILNAVLSLSVTIVVVAAAGLGGGCPDRLGAVALGVLTIRLVIVALHGPGVRPADVDPYRRSGVGTAPGGLRFALSG